MIDERDEALDPNEARALRALQSAERLEPPADLVPSVMRQLSGPSNVLGDRNPEFWSPERRRQSSGGGSMSSRKVLLGIAAVAVLAIAYFAITGFPPVGPGSEATVGAAKRYQSEQISGKDVVLQNAELQAFMQTDVFHSLISDKRALKVLGSETFRDALASQSFRDALANQSFRDALANQSFRDALANQSFRDALANQSFRDALMDQASRDALER